MNSNLIIKNLELMFKEAKCELNYKNDWQLLIAIILSAQSTDKKVNKITPILFEKHPTIESLANAKAEDIEPIIRPIGLSNTKAKNIINLAKILHEQYNDSVPNNKEQLIKLPGVGTKTANVMLIEYFNIPAFPVDTHVSRVSKRLNICQKQDLAPEETGICFTPREARERLTLPVGFPATDSMPMSSRQETA